MAGESEVIGGIFNLINQAKQTSADRKAVTAFLKSMEMQTDPATGQPYGERAYQLLGSDMTKETFGHLSAKDQIAAGSGLVQALTVNRLAADAMAKDQELRQRQEEVPALQRVLRAAMQPGAPAQNVPSQFGGPPLANLPAQEPRFDPDQFMTGMAGEPALMRNLAPRLLPQMLQDEAGVNWADIRPREGATDSGLKYLYGKSGQFQFDPSQFMGGTDTEGNMRAEPVLGPDGEVLSWRMRTGKPGGSVAVGKPKEPREVSATFWEKLADSQALPAQIRRAREAAQWPDARIAALRGVKDPAAFRKGKLAEVEALKAELANLFDSMEDENVGQPETWEKQRKLYGLPARGSATASGRKAAGGYKIGTVYAGLKYLGGDPKQEASWAKAR